MSDDSSDSSELDNQPSGSRSRYHTRNNSDQKRKQRRIVMRIEFDDSDESSSSATSEHSSDDEVVRKTRRGAKSKDLDDENQPSCSQRTRGRRNTKKNLAAHDEEDSDDFQYNAAQRRTRQSGGRRINTLDVGSSDGSTSGSEITNRRKSHGKTSKKYIVSEDERETKSPLKNEGSSATAQKQTDDIGFTSDSSSNEHLEKCPICLLSYRKQEIGSPSACQHIFCASCIEAWSKNVQTCPIDRLEFDRIIVRESYDNRRIVREINVDPNAAKELILEDEDEPEEDVTNCEICNRPDREEIMLLCDHCNQGYHMDCLSPPLSEIPDGSWFCDNCVDSQDEDDDEEDLNMLYEDIRDMGIPQSQLRVREIQQPRILRTRQNERIRAAIMRHTRSNVARVETTTITTTTSSSQRGRPRTTTSTTTTRRTTTNASRSASRSVRKPTRKRRRRRRGARQRTYVVEYDVNNFDEKFAIKATKKVIRRRRRRKVRTSKKSKYDADGVRMTASKRLAEQMGVKPDPKFTSHLSGSSAGLSLTGGPNDLEYFSDSDNGGNIESQIHIETGQGTAVQTSVRISNYGSQRSRKGLLMGRIRPTHIPQSVANRDSANTDILSSILDIQDRWHSASRNMESVHINTDGTLNLPAANRQPENQSHAPSSSSNVGPSSSSNDKKSENEGNTPSSNRPGQNEITQAPMYSRGGGNTNFGGGGGGNYNSRYGGNNNQNNYRGGGGGGYRASTGNAGGGFNMGGRGNFNFNNSSNYNNQDQPPNSTFTPFRQWNYNNQRNQQNEQNSHNNNQRNSLPFPSNQQHSAHPQQQQQQHMQMQRQPPQQPQINPFSGMQPQQPFPTASGAPRQNQDDLFGGLPPPVTRQMSGPMVLSVPPPPTPPAMMVPPAAAALFNISADYGRDDDSNCPNFAIYSQESQEVAKSSEAYPEKVPAADKANEAKEVNFMMICQIIRHWI